MRWLTERKNSSLQLSWNKFAFSSTDALKKAFNQCTLKNFHNNVTKIK